MTNLLVDARFTTHPLALGIPPRVRDEAIALWLRGALWYAREGVARPTTGWIPGDVVLNLCSGRNAPIWALVNGGLWEEDQGWWMDPETTGPLPADRIARRNFPGMRVGGYVILHGPDSGDPLWSVERVETVRAHIPEQLRRAVYARDGHACVTCSSTENLSLDHIYPWSQGGPDTFENLQTLCRSCNSSKGTRV